MSLALQVVGWIEALVCAGLGMVTLAGRMRQGSRLPALWLAFGGIFALMAAAAGVALAAGSPSATLGTDQLVVSLVVLGVIPGLFVGVAPHAWLRSVWRSHAGVVEITRRHRGGAAGQPTAAILPDAGERRRAADELARRVRDLERSNQALEEFAYVASHDLQEPLRVVASYLQLLGSRFKDNLDPTADELIHYAADGARRMQRLIDDLLAYSRIGTEGAPMEPTDLNAVLRTVEANLEVSISETGARVITGELPTVLADAGQLVQLCQNLIGNALKFHGDRTPEVHVGAQRNDLGWTITIRDNGIGIDERHAERIFMVFKRLHPAADYPGTGIGLSSCRKIVERHAGRIWVESEKGIGSAFHFTIPDGAGQPLVVELGNRPAPDRHREPRGDEAGARLAS